MFSVSVPIEIKFESSWFKSQYQYINSEIWPIKCNAYLLESMPFIALYEHWNFHNLWFIKKTGTKITRTTIVVSNGIYTFYQIHFIEHNLSNTIYPIQFIKYHLSNILFQIPFIKYHYQITFIKCTALGD